MHKKNPPVKLEDSSSFSKLIVRLVLECCTVSALGESSKEVTLMVAERITTIEVSDLDEGVIVLGIPW